MSRIQVPQSHPLSSYGTSPSNSVSTSTSTTTPPPNLYTQHGAQSYPMAGPSYSNPGTYPLSTHASSEGLDGIGPGGYHDTHATVPLPQANYTPYYQTHPIPQQYQQTPQYTPSLYNQQRAYQPTFPNQPQLQHHPSLPSLPHQQNGFGHGPKQDEQRGGEGYGLLPPGYPMPAMVNKMVPRVMEGGGGNTGGGGMMAPPDGFGWEDGRFVGEGEEEEEDEKGADGEVRHRRRTTPEQLKTLEYWFAINPKPDNNTREWLAAKMGMTKRNVQVWFQNRRAKLKNVAAKEKAAAERAQVDAYSATTSRTPEAQVRNIMTSPHSRTGSNHSTDGIPQPSYQSLLTQPYHPVRPLPRSAISDSAQPYLQAQPNPSSHLLSPVASVNMGRRVSLANGEVANMESFLAKQRRVATQHHGGSFSPIRSPIMASSARRTSGPYVSPSDAFAASGLASPKVRTMPSTLHLAAMRNNTRRASMPGVPGIVPGMGLIPGAQLLASGPFTPPRVVSGNYPLLNVANGRRTRELSPIKDQDHDPNHESDLEFPGLSLDIPMAAPSGTNGFVFGNIGTGDDFGTTYLTPPNSSYLHTLSPGSYPPDSGSTEGRFGVDYNSSGGSGGMPFTPTGPGVMPGFSFGSTSGGVPVAMGSEEIWSRGRLGSLASINSIGTITTDGTTGSAGSGDEWSDNWFVNGPGQADEGFVNGAVQGGEEFDPDIRRASAPADLLHDLGILGINTSLSPVSGPSSAQPIRPSPLATHFTSDPDVNAVEHQDYFPNQQARYTHQTPVGGHDWSSNMGYSLSNTSMDLRGQRGGVQSGEGSVESASSVDAMGHGEGDQVEVGGGLDWENVI